jgi:hypothetical protein
MYACQKERKGHALIFPAQKLKSSGDAEGGIDMEVSFRDEAKTKEEEAVVAANDSSYARRQLIRRKSW